MPVTVSVIDSYKNFGKCVRIENGTVEAIVTIDMGPRVLKYSFIGGENVFFTDDDRVFNITSPEIDGAFGEGSVYCIAGGHRLWTSPEDAVHSYCPDNDPVEYELTPVGAIFTPAPQKGTKLQHSMELRMADEGTNVTVLTGVVNFSGVPQVFAPWNITQCAPGGVEILPFSRKETGLLPDRQMTIWPYTDMNDPRVFFGNDYITLRQDSNISDKFKVGINNRAGWAAYINAGNCFVKRYRHNESGAYPDFGVSYETFTNNLFIELETITELSRVPVGGSLMGMEVWELIKCGGIKNPRDEAEISAFVKDLKL